MKKIFLVLVLLLSVFILFAEDRIKTYNTGSLISFSLEKGKETVFTITGIYPYEDGYLLLLTDDEKVTLKYYVNKGTTFFTRYTRKKTTNQLDDRVEWVYCEATITDIKPNYMTVSSSEYKVD